VSEAEVRQRQQQERQRAEIERRAAEAERQRVESERRAVAEAERQRAAIEPRAGAEAERQRRMEEEERSWAELGRRVEDVQRAGGDTTHHDADTPTGRVEIRPPSHDPIFMLPAPSAPPAPVPQPIDSWEDLPLIAPPPASARPRPQGPRDVFDVPAPPQPAAALSPPPMRPPRESLNVDAARPIGVPPSMEPPPGKIREPMAPLPTVAAPRSAGSPLASIWHTVTSPFRLLGRLPSAFRRSTSREPEPSPSTTPEAVLLGASAPRCVRAGEPFVVRFVAYVEHVEAHATRQLRELDPAKRPDERTIAVGLPTTRGGRWMVGAPVTVRLTGNGLTGDRSTASFEWKGTYNVVSFTMSVAPAAAVSQVHLSVEAFIEGVPVGGVPLTLDVSDRAPEAQRVTSVRRPFSSAFASYASQDAPMVSLCLSALHRWDPDVDVFMDCLDLTPNEDWKRELQRIIPTKEAFLLFWSANARRSPWVAWELEMAAAARGVESIVPMPLEDPDMAPPPDRLKHLHFRDRYLIAHQALRTAARLAP
jgi:TIR domain